MRSSGTIKYFSPTRGRYGDISMTSHSLVAVITQLYWGKHSSSQNILFSKLMLHLAGLKIALILTSTINRNNDREIKFVTDPTFPGGWATRPGPRVGSPPMPWSPQSSPVSWAMSSQSDCPGSVSLSECRKCRLF